MGVTAFVCFCSLGVMVIFWDRMLPGLPRLQKIGFGSLIIVYAAIRFSRILRREKDEV